MNVTSEDLRFLAEQPIGSAALQAEADRIAHRGIKPSGELKDTIKRVAKKWLPQGKKPFSVHEDQAAKRAFYARQIDIEDAVEAAGGKRGGHKA